MSGSSTFERAIGLRVSSHTATSLHLPPTQPFWVHNGIRDLRRDQPTFGMPVTGVPMGRYVEKPGGSWENRGRSWMHLDTILHSSGNCRGLNTKVQGRLNSRKSSWVKSHLFRTCWLYKRTSLVIDPKDEYWRLVKYIPGARLIDYAAGRGLILNPLDWKLDARPEEFDEDQEFDQHANHHMIVVSLARIALPSMRELTVEEDSLLREVIIKVKAMHPRGGGRDPIMEDLVELLFSPTTEIADNLRTTPSNLKVAGREVALALRQYTQGKLQGVANGQTSGKLFDPCPCQVINLKNIQIPELKAAVGLLLLLLADGFDTLAVDEFWDVVNIHGLDRALQRRFKLSRTTNKSTILVMHSWESIARSTDSRVAEDLLTDSDINLFFNSDPGMLSRHADAFGLNPSQIDRISGYPNGTAMLGVGPKWYEVEHIRWDIEEPLVETSHANLGKRDLDRNAVLMPFIHQPEMTA